jgi:hypothetical protein
VTEPFSKAMHFKNHIKHAPIVVATLYPNWTPNVQSVSSTPQAAEGAEGGVLNYGGLQKKFDFFVDFSFF